MPCTMEVPETQADTQTDGTNSITSTADVGGNLNINGFISGTSPAKPSFGLSTNKD